MTETPNRLSMSIAIFCTAFMLQMAHADQALVPVAAPNYFIIQLPDVDREALVEQVGALRSQLIQRKQVLLMRFAY